MNEVISKIGQVALMGLLATTLMACGSDDDGKGPIDEAKTASIQTDTPSIDFAATAQGEPVSEGIRISNVGEGTLRITSIRLVEDTDSDEGGVEFQRGELWETTAEIPTDGFIDLDVVYTPLDSSPDTGRIIIESNDPLRNPLTIPINSADLAPRIFSQTPIAFTRVPPVTDETRDKNWQLTTVNNIGESPLTINDVVVVGNDFKVTFPANDDPNSDPATDSDQWPGTLGPDESFPVRVYFNPIDNEPSTADLIFFSNDPENSQYTVKLQGNSGAPCIKLSQEDEINFGEGGIGFANNKTITVENCSPTSDLTISSIEVTDDGGGVYAVKEGSLPTALPDGDAVIPPDNTANFVLTYTPTDLSVSNGLLNVQSDDPAKSDLNIPIVGKGTNNVCPQAVAEARVKDTSRYQQMIRTIPLKNIELRGTNSTDTNGTVASYEWTIISRPPNSTARLEPSNSSSEPTLFLDLAGTYVIELVVYDEEGLASCSDDDSKQVVIQAVPDEDIHVQLVWDTPTDADQTDGNGTDLDLHYLHPQGNWNRGNYDIYWRNPTADWGASGPADDPSLDIDDRDGAGPENVNHNNPESDLIYAVGVHYYADNGLGPSYATLRIFINGVQKYEYRDQYLAGAGQFWRAAGIKWPSGEIIGINAVTNGFPN